MKVLFQPIYLETPHFETELELMADHLDAGDEVHVLACHGELGTCFANYDHEPSHCRRCQARCSTGLALLDPRVRLLCYPFAREPRYPAIPDVVPDFDTLLTLQVGHAQIGICAASSLCTRFNSHRFDTVRHCKEVAIELNTAYYVYTAVRHILLQVKPDRMYVFNGRFSTALPALNACDEAGVPYTTHERGGTAHRYWVLPDTIPHDIEHAYREMQAKWRSYPPAESVRRGEQFFIDRRDRVEHSWYCCTTSQNTGHLPEGFNASKRNVAIFNSSLAEFAAVRCWPTSILVYEDETDALVRICSAFERDESYHFYLRVHPHLSGSENAQTRQLRTLDGRFRNLTIIPPESIVDSYALLEHSTAVITFGSTMGAEASFWGKPSILVGRAYYENLDCAYKPRTHAAVVELLRFDLPPKSRTDALMYGLWDLELGKPFRRYVPESLTRGTFKGVRIADAR